MKYLLILLMAGIGAAKAQSNKQAVDTCSKYGDSVIKYQKNVEIWNRQYRPGMTILEKTALDALITQLRMRREEFMVKLKNCK